jgi:hypothetical protein
MQLVRQHGRERFELAAALFLVRFLAAMPDNCPKELSELPLDFCFASSRTAASARGQNGIEPFGEISFSLSLKRSLSESK